MNVGVSVLLDLCNFEVEHLINGPWSCKHRRDRVDNVD